MTLSFLSLAHTDSPFSPPARSHLSALQITSSANAIRSRTQSMFKLSIASSGLLSRRAATIQPLGWESSRLVGFRRWGSTTKAQLVMPGGLASSKDSPVRKSASDSKHDGVAGFASLTSLPIHPSADLQNTHLALTLPNSRLPSSSLTLPYVWLRDSCPCPSCVHPETRQKLHRTTDVPLDIKPKRLTWVSPLDKGTRWDLEVEWDRPLWKHDTGSTGIEGYPQDTVGGDGHKSRYSERWFQTWADQTKVRERYHEHALEMVPWLRQDLMNPDGGSKLYHSWKELNGNKRVLLDVLTQLTNSGIVFLQGVPTSKDKAGDWEVQKIANMFSQVRETMWGKMWDVKSVPSRRGLPGRNVAFTEMDLDLHMDLL